METKEAKRGLRYWYSEGEEVAHVTNLTFKMTIKLLLYKQTEIFCDEKEPNAIYDTHQKRFIRSKKLLIGIRCQWLTVDGVQVTDFHSRELVPWKVAQKGSLDVDKFRAEQ